MKKAMIPAVLLVSVLQACSVLATADDVTGTSPQLEGYNIGALETMVVEGKTNLPRPTGDVGRGHSSA